MASEATSRAAAPSLMLEALPAVTVPSGPKAGFRPRSFASSNLRGPLVGGERGGLAPDGDLHRHDLVGGDARLDGLAGAGVAADGEVVLQLLGEAELLGTTVGEDAHVLVAEGVRQAVVDQRVDTARRAPYGSLRGP